MDQPEDRNEIPLQWEPRPYDGAFEAADPLTQQEVLEIIKANQTWVDTPRLRDYVTDGYLAAGG